MSTSTLIRPLDLVPGKKSFLAADGSGTSWGNLLAPCFGLPKGTALHPNLMPLSRDFILSCPAVMDHFGTVIHLDENASGTLLNGENTVAFLRRLGIHSIVKSDGGLTPFIGGNEGEEIGEVRNALPKWAKKMAEIGVVGTKHRTVYTMTPSDALIAAATFSQVQNSGTILAHGMSPCIEPEIMGGHNKLIDQHAAVSARVLDSVYAGCRKAGLNLAQTSLKISFVGNGQKATHSTPEEVAVATVDLIAKHVPEEVPLVVFLSGGWEPIDYYAYLSATVNEANRRGLKQVLRASASRAAFQDAYTAWNNNWVNIPLAQEVMTLRGIATTAACRGEYNFEAHEAPIRARLAR